MLLVLGHNGGMRAYLIVLEVEPMEVGRVYSKGLLLHCTIMHWFRVNASHQSVLSVIGSVVATTSPILLTSGQPDLFGPSVGPKTIVVNHLIKTAEIRDLHMQLFESLQALVPMHTEPSYTKEGFTLHVTKQGTRRLSQGMTHRAEYAYLVEALDAEGITQKIVRAKIGLSGSA